MGLCFTSIEASSYGGSHQSPRPARHRPRPPPIRLWQTEQRKTKLQYRLPTPYPGKPSKTTPELVFSCQQGVTMYTRSLMQPLWAIRDNWLIGLLTGLSQTVAVRVRGWCSIVSSREAPWLWLIAYEVFRPHIHIDPQADRWRPVNSGNSGLESHYFIYESWNMTSNMSVSPAGEIF